MAILRGTTIGRERILPGVCVEIKNEQFETLFETVSDEAGHFSLSVPDGVYPFLTAVREYGDRYLEYWAQDVPARGELTLDIRIDAVEVYGLHAFHVKGAANALTVYFRPMSLRKFKARAHDIAPELDKRDVTVLVDGQQSEIYTLNRVQEYAGEDTGLLTAYLLQASVPQDADKWKQVDVTVRDSDGRFGCATLFQ